MLSGKSACDCIAVMLEIHKRAYFSPDGAADPEKLNAIGKVIRQIVADGAGR